MLNEFREFLQRGNVIDLAVAVIIGGAFGAIVKSLVNDVVMPIIGILLGGLDFTSFAIVIGESEILYGNFIQAIVNFVIIALVIFLVVRSYNKLKKQEEEAPAAPAAPPKPSPEETLLAEIRDLLKAQQ
ncbi:MAG: large-conductance mechanosensitive channel protein MscL [Chloroflexi bacterium]|nr:large-conductance mechanosensitive channel protein MscL [Chloroflexota bacterium]